MNSAIVSVRSCFEQGDVNIGWRIIDVMVSWVFDHILDLYSRVNKERFCIAGDEPRLEGCGIRGKGVFGGDIQFVLGSIPNGAGTYNGVAVLFIFWEVIVNGALWM